MINSIVWMMIGATLATFVMRAETTEETKDVITWTTIKHLSSEQMLSIAKEASAEMFSTLQDINVKEVETVEKLTFHDSNYNWNNNKEK